MVRTAFQRFHGFSKHILVAVISFSDAMLISNFESLSFKGIFLVNVTPNAAMIYKIEAARRNANLTDSVSPACKNAARLQL